MARYRGGSLASIAACRKSHALLWTNWCWAPAAARHAEPAARGTIWKSTRVSAPDWRYRPAGGALSPPPGPAEPYGYDFQRQAWFARLGAVGYTRSPVMLWRAAPVERDGLTVQKWRRQIGAYMWHICQPAALGWRWPSRLVIECILIETCSKRSGPPIFRIFWRFLACIWACSPVWCSFLRGLLCPAFPI